MARKRKSRTRRLTRRSPMKRYGRRKKGMGLAGSLAAAALYGAGREYVSNKLQPITSKIPLGGYADEAVMAGLGYLLHKGKVPFLNKVPLLRKAGYIGMHLEAARVGSTVFPNLGTSSNSGGGSDGWS